ncbi:hypothetical protein V502_04514 [Pseudogymnoascus sp. VKM F-4520 (FW-2644)]|nr:hypothetical protein V502_04514 [Pseudogymnoascus sp. VKM F-4520 (FW-2644)]
MLFAEEDAPQLKTWIVKRLENTSDADADVLADYVLALLRHDGDIETVRSLCEEEIPDFLKEDSTIFVKDLFDTVQHRSFMPGAPPPPQPPAPTLPNANAPLGTSYNNFDMASVPTGPNASKKRSFNDRGDADTQMGPMDATGRAVKQARRNGNMVAGGHYDSFGNYMPPQPNRRFQTPQDFPPMPPTDPNDPMAAMLAMQAMGFPVQGMPGFDQNAAGPRGPGGRQGQGQMGGRRCRDYDTKGFCARGNSCKFEHGQDSIYVPHGVVDEYDPTNSSLVVGAEGAPTGMRTQPGGGHQFPGAERGRGRGRGQFGNRGGPGGAPSRRGGRAEFSSDRPNFDRSKTTIVVENIPEEKFSEEAVRAFFSEFGEIGDVTMQAYKRLALVKYNDWNAAQAAYNSPKVIFDNRFVKVYWYKDEASLPRPPGGNAGEAFTAVTSGDVASGVSARSASETRIDVEEFTRKQAEVQKAHEEKMKKKTEMEAAVAAMQKRQEDLMKRQAEEKRKLMERLAAKEGTAQPSGESDGAEGKPASQAEALKKQLAALEAEARSLGLDPAQAEENSWGGWGGRGRGRGRGAPGMRGAYPARGARGGYRGRGGAGFAPGPNPYKLDNRPKKIGISGVDFTHAEKDESLRQYLLGVGEYADIETTPKSTSITFKDRFTAEKFMYGISNSEIPGVGKVDLAWIQTPLPPVVLPSAAPVAKPDTARNDQENRDTDMGGSGEGDAMAQDLPRGPAQSQKREQQELDYDIGDDNEWAQ